MDFVFPAKLMCLMFIGLKGSFREKLKGLKAYVEKYSMMIATLMQ